MEQPLAALPRFATDLFLPRYAPMRQGDWELRIAPMVLCSGYWSPAVLCEDMAALVRGGESWMSMTPLEIESQEIGVRLAQGHVLIFGLGMGWSAAASALRDAVTAVTIVERDPDVIALIAALDPFAQLPPAARAKIRVIEGDAFAYVPDRPVDLLMPDIWLPLVSDGRVEQVRRMQANVRAAAVYFWGQELEIARHARAAGRRYDTAEGIAATIADFGLPLIGPDYPDYPRLLATAAQARMGHRWLDAAPAVS